MDEAEADKEWRDKFRARLRQVRGGRTREVMADLLGVSPSAYAKWEDRGSEMPLRLLPKIWKIGEVTPEWLLEGKEPQAKPAKKQAVEVRNRA
jgi:transcriptional regulator with XRE-family HTH domain